MTLTEFLLARIAEDEAQADDFWVDDYPGDPEPGTWWHWVHAECDAKRRIIELQVDTTKHAAIAVANIFASSLSAYDAVLSVLALPYADHPDYPAAAGVHTTHHKDTP